MDMEGNLVDACELLERNPSMQQMRVIPRLGIEFSFKWNLTMISVAGERSDFVDEVLDVDVWKRLGRAVRQSDLHELSVFRYNSDFGGLKFLRLESEEPGSLEQSTALSRPISFVNLTITGHLSGCWRCVQK
jgi:hypothetical protein